MNENNFDIISWLKVFQERLISLFGNRIKFFGLQGSYDSRQRHRCGNNS